MYILRSIMPVFLALAAISSIGSAQLDPGDTVYIPVFQDLPEDSMFQNLPENSIFQDFPENSIFQDLPESSIFQEHPEDAIVLELPEDAIVLEQSLFQVNSTQPVEQPLMLKGEFKDNTPRGLGPVHFWIANKLTEIESSILKFLIRHEIIPMRDYYRSWKTPMFEESHTTVPVFIIEFLYNGGFGL